jgi:hypothetical protein
MIVANLIDGLAVFEDVIGARRRDPRHVPTDHPVQAVDFVNAIFQ